MRMRMQEVLNARNSGRPEKDDSTSRRRLSGPKSAAAEIADQCAADRLGGGSSVALAYYASAFKFGGGCAAAEQKDLDEKQESTNSKLQLVPKKK